MTLARLQYSWTNMENSPTTLGLSSQPHFELFTECVVTEWVSVCLCRQYCLWMYLCPEISDAWRRKSGVCWRTFRESWLQLDLYYLLVFSIFGSFIHAVSCTFMISRQIKCCDRDPVCEQGSRSQTGTHVKFSNYHVLGPVFRSPDFQRLPCWRPSLPSSLPTCLGSLLNEFWKDISHAVFALSALPKIELNHPRDNLKARESGWNLIILWKWIKILMFAWLTENISASQWNV